MVVSMKYLRKLFLAATVASVLTLQPVLADHHKAAGQTAVAVLETTNQRVAPQARVLGEVRFQQMGDKIHITGRLEGLEPNSVHGFVILMRVKEAGALPCPTMRNLESDLRVKTF